MSDSLTSIHSFSRLCAGLAALSFGALRSPAQAWDWMLAEARTVLSAGLDANGNHRDANEMVWVICQVAKKDYVELRSELRTVVEQYATHRARADVSGYAMQALLLLGEPLPYFEALAESMDAPRIAGYALMLLASHPTAELRQKLLTLQQTSTDEFLGDCVEEALRSICLIGACQKADTVAIQATLLLENAMQGFELGSYTGDPYQPFGGGVPSAIWARRKLLSFGVAHPRELADAFNAIDRKSDYPEADDAVIEQMNKALKGYAHQFLPANVQALVGM